MPHRKLKELQRSVVAEAETGQSLKLQVNSASQSFLQMIVPVGKLLGLIQGYHKYPLLDLFGLVAAAGFVVVVAAASVVEVGCTAG